MREETRDEASRVAVPVSLVKDVLFVIDLLAHAGAGEIELSLRATPFVFADRWLVRRFLLRTLLPLLPPQLGGGKLRVEIDVESTTGVIRATHPSALHVVWTEPKKLASELRGELVVEGGRDRGTIVTIRLPLAAMRTPRRSAGPDPQPVAPPRARKESPCAPSEPTSRCA